MSPSSIVLALPLFVCLSLLYRFCWGGTLQGERAVPHFLSFFLSIGVLAGEDTDRSILIICLEKFGALIIFNYYFNCTLNIFNCAISYGIPKNLHLFGFFG